MVIKQTLNIFFLWFNATLHYWLILWFVGHMVWGVWKDGHAVVADSAVLTQQKLSRPYARNTAPPPFPDSSIPFKQTKIDRQSLTAYHGYWISQYVVVITPQSEYLQLWCGCTVTVQSYQHNGWLTSGIIESLLTVRNSNSIRLTKLNILIYFHYKSS